MNASETTPSHLFSISTDNNQKSCSSERIIASLHEDKTSHFYLYYKTSQQEDNSKQGYLKRQRETWPHQLPRTAPRKDATPVTQIFTLIPSRNVKERGVPLLFLWETLRWLPIVLRSHARWGRKFTKSARARRETSVFFDVLLRQHEQKKQNWQWIYSSFLRWNCVKFGRLLKNISLWSELVFQGNL